MKKVLNDDRGFSLIELLVVIAISAILIAMVTVSLTLIHGANVDNSANKLDALFNKARTVSMAKGQTKGKLTLELDADGTLWGKIGDGDKESICNGMQEVHFDATCEALKNTVGGSAFSGTVEYIFNSDGSVSSTSTGPARITFTRRKKHSQVLFYLDTGKHVKSRFFTVD